MPPTVSIAQNRTPEYMGGARSRGFKRVPPDDRPWNAHTHMVLTKWNVEWVWPARDARTRKTADPPRDRLVTMPRMRMGLLSS